MHEKSNRLSRRKFVRDAGSVVGGIALSSVAGGEVLSASPSAPDVKVPMGVLGRTGVNVSRLGVGCATFRLKEVSVEKARKILHRALEFGVNYIDVAPNYGDEEGGFSEEKIGPTVRNIRKRIFLVTKTEEPTYEGTWRLLRQSMKRLQTDHFDLVHIHNFGLQERFPDVDLALSDKGALGALREAKKKGVVRFIGASGHLFPSRFHAVLDTGEIDVVMNAVNFIVQHTYDFESKVWSRARREKLGLVAMKVLGGRTARGFKMPTEYYERAIRYALSIPGLSSAVIGVRSVAQIEKAARTVATVKPLSPAESHALAMEGLRLANAEEWRTAYGGPIT